MALLPFASFAQNAQSKVSVRPGTQKAAVAKSAAPSMSYAPAAYCIPMLDCSDGDSITNVNFAGINNTTSCSPNGYGNYTSIVTTSELLAGSTYPIKVTVGDGWAYENVSVWIDYNKNDIFEPSEFTYIGNVNNIPSGYVVPGNITIPTGTANGDYRMRVRVHANSASETDNTLACDEEEFYGETEDYTLKIGATAPTGCLTSPNGAYPTAAYTPVCNGTATAISTLCYAGEYSTVNVTTGTQYTFSLSKPTYFITIANSTGTTVLGSGTGSLTWTSTVTGPVRFYSHTNDSCGSGSSETMHSRLIKCGSVPVEPIYGCDQNYTGVPDLASNITKTLTGSTSSYAVANDFFVPKASAQYKIQTITANMVPLSGGADIASFDVKIMSDNGSKAPGAVVKSWTGVVPVSITTLPDLFAGYATYQVKLDLANYELPVNTAADTRYWISLQANSATSTSIYWIGYRYTEGWVTAPNYQSTNGGTSYVMATDTNSPGVHFESIWSIDAECSVAAVSEAGNKNLSFFPNPVKDFLTINSKKAIETLHIYNVAGQKMPVASKLVNGKVDMSRLAPGVYIISTILEGGINESFKVIKK
ncbi:GEVED domain-containing protein [Kaistella flava (ex Peng et al. 2021)]|nr:GEVED domain-containing protein [Kaistella flava (ex Peng et al. 2021)]